MTTADYNAAIANLNTSMGAEVGAQIDANKAAIVDLFPILARLLIGGILWPCLLKIGRVIGAALVGLMLKKLGQMTLADVAELINKYLSNAKMPPMELGHGLAYMGGPKTRPVFHAVGDSEGKQGMPVNPDIRLFSWDEVEGHPSDAEPPAIAEPAKFWPGSPLITNPPDVRTIKVTCVQSVYRREADGACEITLAANLSATEVRAILDAAYSPSARLTLTIETPRS